MLTLPRDDRGSMPLAMLLTVVGLGLSMVLASMLTAEQRNTRRDAGRAAALAAAQSGIDAALSAIRLAVRDEDLSGDPQALPCTTGTPLAGTVDAGGSTRYSVRLHYSLSAPDPATVPSPLWVCGSTASGMPAYALIEATGTVGTPTVSRTLWATYAFTSIMVNEKVPGGIIRTFGTAGSPDFCFAAGSSTPQGSQLLIRPCNAADPRQQFVYTAGLALALRNIGNAAKQRLCLDAGTMVVDTAVTFQPCTSSPTARQVWGSDDASAFYVMPTASTRMCMESSAEYADATVSLAAMKSALYCTPAEYWTERQTFLTASATGGGRAGPGTGQLVNSAQFGRCVDVTANDISRPYLVSFPCKQQLTGEVLWNQRWNLPPIAAGDDSADGPVWTTVDDPWNADHGTTVCLRSPGSTVRPDYYVTVTRCDPSGVIDSDQRWRVYGDTGNKVTSYRIEATSGHSTTCLSVTDPAASSPDLWNDVHNLDVSKLVMATCSDNHMQKWNAFTWTTDAAVKSVTER
jgi:hypothetical protein